MGFDPVGAIELVDEFGDDESEINSLLFDLENIARARDISGMVRTAHAARIARAQKGTDFEKWVRLQRREAKPRKRKTIFERLGADEPKRPGIFDRLKE